MRRDDGAKSRGSTGSEESTLSLETSNARKLPTDVAKACYALALAVLDGDHDHARVLARKVMAAAIEQMADQG